MPIINGVKTVVLYLEGWQKRMVKDVLGIDCDTYTVKLVEPVVLRYAVVTSENLKRMYFTDWQIREMKDEAGVACEFVELRKDPIVPMYAAPMHSA
jgi:hypothetical protein